MWHKSLPKLALIAILSYNISPARTGSSPSPFQLPYNPAAGTIHLPICIGRNNGKQSQQVILETGEKISGESGELNSSETPQFQQQEQPREATTRQAEVNQETTKESLSQDCPKEPPLCSKEDCGGNNGNFKCATLHPTLHLCQCCQDSPPWCGYEWCAGSELTGRCESELLRGCRCERELGGDVADVEIAED